jgi:LysM repeat protein
MSVATEFPPEVYIPVQARPRTATVLPFRARPAVDPVVEGDSLRQAARRTATVYPVRPVVTIGEPVRVHAPLRLTRRGYAVLGLLAATVAAGLLWLAHSSAPADTPAGGAAAVTVHSGDTLWSIATRVAPQRDPRITVAALERLNHLDGPAVQPGQVLRTR